MAHLEAEQELVEVALDTLAGHLDSVTDTVFPKSGIYIVSGSWDNTIIVWKQLDETSYEQFQKLIVHTNDIEDVEFYKDD